MSEELLQEEAQTMKRRVTGDEYVARRAGQINEETHYVLKKFGVDVPGLLQNVKLKITRSSFSINSLISSSLDAPTVTFPLAKYPCSFPVIIVPSSVSTILRYCVLAEER